MREYLIMFTHKWNAMRLPELLAVAALEGIPVEYDEAEARALDVVARSHVGADARTEASCRETCFLRVRLPSDEAARRLAARPVLTEMIVSLWGEGADWESARASVEAHAAERVSPCFPQGTTFRVRVYPFGHRYNHEEQLAAMHRLLAGVIPAHGVADLKHPALRIAILSDHGVRILREGDGDGRAPARPLRRVYVGRVVARAPGLRSAEPYRLPARRYLGPTSMDHELSMVIANQAHARPGATVLDPYCGTASILVGCAHFGARVLGAELDGRLLAGKGGDRTIPGNFAQYGLEPPLGLVRADFAQGRDCWRMVPWLDAIVCDPPYGIRAPSKRLAEGYERSRWADSKDFVPRREGVTIGPILSHLFEFAAAALVPGGRVVLLVPITADMLENEMPTHPQLRVLASSQQYMTTRWSRRLVTLEKVAEPADARAGANRGGNGATAQLFERGKVLGEEAHRRAATLPPLGRHIRAEARWNSKRVRSHRLRRAQRALRWCVRIALAVAPVAVAAAASGRI